MIDLYYWTTPNGHKISLFLEEAGLPYEVHPVNIGQGDQFKPEFLKIAPNNRIPAIVDQQPADGGAPISLFESGAILLYLAEKTGRFIPQDLRGRQEALQWLFWQMGGLGPMAGQNHHFNVFAPEKIPYAIKRYIDETARLYGVLDRRLADRAFVAGEDYSIADMAIYPWIVPRTPKPEAGRLPACAALVQPHQATPGHRAGLCVGGQDQPAQTLTRFPAGAGKPLLQRFASTCK
ncbi:MAG: Disulfide-bond oxidoreductase YfcG [Pseudomonas fluorescens]|nr:MAG: Disulfide-bond oxidoreductase YfcG [Pseudomonas fluorescens]